MPMLPETVLFPKRHPSRLSQTQIRTGRRSAMVAKRAEGVDISAMVRCTGFYESHTHPMAMLSSMILHSGSILTVSPLSPPMAFVPISPPSMANSSNGVSVTNSPSPSHGCAVANALISNSYSCSTASPPTSKLLLVASIIAIEKSKPRERKVRSFRMFCRLKGQCGFD